MPRRYLIVTLLSAPPLVVAALTELNYRLHWQMPVLSLCVILPLLVAARVARLLSWPWIERLTVLIPYAIVAFFASGFALFYVAGRHGDAL